jgi:UDP-N-acetylglucosamine--N-acetylmuramyl-(pentapeptide) pyrophosphoryl-undecaprenol N-acetylglucosamine transferase
MENKVEVLWVGGEGGMEAQLLERAKVPFTTIPAAGIHGVSVKTLPGNIVRLTRGFFAARRILKEFKPDVLFFTGGYLAVPMALAGLHVPTMLFVPDIEPALALKTLARFADKIAVTAEDSFRYFKHPERLVLTGYPTRSDLNKWTRLDARHTLNIMDDAPVLLIFGGSKGARSINNVVIDKLPFLLEKVQVIHITGEMDWQVIRTRAKELTKLQVARYHAFPYLHEEMGAALAAADLALSRAGASTLGEFPLFGLPAILVPYPYAWRYQKGNAKALVQSGAAVMIENDKLSDQLLPIVEELLSQPQKLASMRAAMHRLSHPEAAAVIGRQIMALCQERS